MLGHQGIIAAVSGGNGLDWTLLTTSAFFPTPGTWSGGSDAAGLAPGTIGFSGDFATIPVTNPSSTQIADGVDEGRYQFATAAATPPTGDLVFTALRIEDDPDYGAAPAYVSGGVGLFTNQSSRDSFFTQVGPNDSQASISSMAVAADTLDGTVAWTRAGNPVVSLLATLRSSSGARAFPANLGNMTASGGQWVSGWMPGAITSTAATTSYRMGVLVTSPVITPVAKRSLANEVSFKAEFCHVPIDFSTLTWTPIAAGDLTKLADPNSLETAAPSTGPNGGLIISAASAAERDIPNGMLCYEIDMPARTQEQVVLFQVRLADESSYPAGLGGAFFLFAVDSNTAVTSSRLRGAGVRFGTSTTDTYAPAVASNNTGACSFANSGPVWASGQRAVTVIHQMGATGRQYWPAQAFALTRDATGLLAFRGDGSGTQGAGFPATSATQRTLLLVGFDGTFLSPLNTEFVVEYAIVDVIPTGTFDTDAGAVAGWSTGYSMDLTGTYGAPGGQYMQATGPVAPAFPVEGWSATCWVKTEGGTGTSEHGLVGRWVDDNNRWWVQLQPTVGGGTTTLVLRSGGAAYTAPNASGLPTPGNWINVGVTVRRVAGQFFADVSNNGTVGTAAGSATFAAADVDAAALQIGTNGKLAAYYWLDGNICDVALWGAPLEPGELASLYNNGTRANPGTRTPLTPVALWPVLSTDDATGTTGSIAELISGDDATPYNTTSADLENESP